LPLLPVNSDQRFGVGARHQLRVKKSKANHEKQTFKHSIRIYFHSVLDKRLLDNTSPQPLTRKIQHDGPDSRYSAGQILGR
jgi:hypothetical protein